MKLERTLSIIKPDAVANNHIGGIIQMLEKAGLQVIAAKMVHMTQEDAEGFYAVHKERGFFRELVDFMTSGPSLVMVLEGEHAVKTNRDVMGATDPKKAEKGTIRATFATSIDANAVHGSDSLENAQKEIQFFFTEHNICERRKHKAQHQGCGCAHHH